MTKISFVKLSFVCLAACAAAFSGLFTARAYPNYLRVFAADPLSRPELRAQCATCHVNPEGGGDRNDFGKAFAAAGFKITPELRAQFPDRFIAQTGDAQTPPVNFVAGSDSQAVVEINGKKFLIDTKAKTVSEVRAEAAPAAAETARPSVTAAPTPTPTPESERPGVYRQMDVRLISLPTAKPIAKGSLWTDFTHRFPFGDYDVTDAAGLFGLDGFAVPSFGFIYGLTDRIHVGVYRSPSNVGRPISIYAGASLLDEQRGHPLTAMAHLGIEGRDNFQRNFTTSFDLTFARSVTEHAQLYVVPTVSFNNRPLTAFAPPQRNLPGETTFALGVGGAFNVRPLVALIAEANFRVNEEGRFGSTRPAFGFGIEKATASGKHAFSLVFTNGVGTTMAQRSGTRGAIFGFPGSADESFKGLTIGFNLSRRLF
jgi:hypothetical protein